MSGMNLMSERLFALSGDGRSFPETSDTERSPAKRFTASDGRWTLGGTALLGTAAGFIETGVPAKRFAASDGRWTLGGTALLGTAAGFIETGVEVSRSRAREISAIS